MENKAAWEEAFARRSADWGKGTAPVLKPELTAELKELDIAGKDIAQFCCNDGRELRALVQLGAASGTGFDIAENMIAYANKKAVELGLNCRFAASDILEIGPKFNDTFDFIFITIGALCWFADLPAFFRKVSDCLKPGGTLVIHEMHPAANMFAAKGEDNYEENTPDRAVNSYFKTEPWIENHGMKYIAGENYPSKTFFSYSQTFDMIINAVIGSGIDIRKLKEFNADLSGLFGQIDRNRIPLSYLLIGRKPLSER